MFQTGNSFLPPPDPEKMKKKKATSLVRLILSCSFYSNLCSSALIFITLMLLVSPYSFLYIYKFCCYKTMTSLLFFFFSNSLVKWASCFERPIERGMLLTMCKNLMKLPLFPLSKYFVLPVILSLVTSLTMFSLGTYSGASKK